MELAEISTFSFSDEWIYDRIDTSQLSADGSGILTISKDDLEELQDSLRSDGKLTDDEKQRYLGILDQIGLDMASNAGEYVEYNCG
jgi:hypothetical protein